MSLGKSGIFCTTCVVSSFFGIVGLIYYGVVVSSPFPGNSIYYARDISLGIALKDSEDLRAASSSIKRIRKSLDDISGSFAPNIIALNVSGVEEYRRLRKEDSVRFFFGFTDEDLEDLESPHEPATIISPYAEFLTEKVDLIRNNFDFSLFAKSYMEYFKNSRKNIKTTVICVLSPEDSKALHFYENLKTYENENLEISLPVSFAQKSEFPSSDAWQIVSDIGSKLALAKRPYIFFLSDSNYILPYIADVLQVHPDISHYPWILRHSLRNKEEKLMRLSEKVGLLSLSFFALGDDATNIKRRRQCVEDEIPLKRCHIYESIMRFHRSAVAAIRDKSNLQTAYVREGYESPDSLSLVSGILAASYGDGTIRDLIKVKRGNVTDIIFVKEIRLSKEELKRLMPKEGGSKIEISLDPEILFPYSRLIYKSLDEFPEYLVIPQAKNEKEFGTSLYISINSEHFYVCVPNKLDRGDFECDQSGTDSTSQNS